MVLTAKSVTLYPQLYISQTSTFELSRLTSLEKQIGSDFFSFHTEKEGRTAISFVWAETYHTASAVGKAAIPSKIAEMIGYRRCIGSPTVLLGGIIVNCGEGF